MVEFFRRLEGDGATEARIAGNPIDLTKPLTLQYTRLKNERTEEWHDAYVAEEPVARALFDGFKLKKLFERSPELYAIVKRSLNPHQVFSERLADRKRAKEIIEELEA